jgi:hypothetical protein
MNKIGKSLVKLTKKKIHAEGKKSSVTDSDTGRVVREHSQQRYISPFSNSDARDQFLESHQLPRLTQEEINMTSPVSITEIQFKTFQKKKSPSLDSFTNRQILSFLIFFFCWGGYWSLNS